MCYLYAISIYLYSFIDRQRYQNNWGPSSWSWAFRWRSAGMSMDSALGKKLMDFRKKTGDFTKGWCICDVYVYDVYDVYDVY